VSKLQGWKAHGDTLQVYKKTLHWMFQLLQRMQGLISSPPKGHALCDKDTVRALSVAPAAVSLFQKAKVEKTVRKHQLSQSGP
jgi:hypothetical protein